MLIEMRNTKGKNNVEKVREVDVQHYLDLGYERIEKAETIELMSPAGKVIVAKKDLDDYLQREGWSLLEDVPAEPAEPVKEPEQSPEPEVPAEEPEVPVEESEVPAEPEIPSEVDEATDAQMEE